MCRIERSLALLQIRTHLVKCRGQIPKLVVGGYWQVVVKSAGGKLARSPILFSKLGNTPQVVAAA